MRGSHTHAQHPAEALSTGGRTGTLAVRPPLTAGCVTPTVSDAFLLKAEVSPGEKKVFEMETVPCSAVSSLTL